MQPHFIKENRSDFAEMPLSMKVTQPLGGQVEQV